MSNGELRLHVQGSTLWAWVAPTVKLNHEFLPVTYGENVYPVVPGSHTLEVFGEWMWKYGRVSRPLEIRSGETVELWYAAPVLTFLPGRLGVGKQRHAGLVGLVVFLVLVVALIVWLMTL